MAASPFTARAVSTSSARKTPSTSNGRGNRVVALPSFSPTAYVALSFRGSPYSNNLRFLKCFFANKNMLSIPKSSLNLLNTRVVAEIGSAAYFCILVPKPDSGWKPRRLCIFLVY